MCRLGIAQTVVLAVAATGCADLFNLEPVTLGSGGSGDGGTAIAPVQQVPTFYEQRNLDMPITHTFSVPRTTAGNSLVLAAVVDTSSHYIESVQDDGGNTWVRLLDGKDPTNTDDCRLEVWRTDVARSAANITVALDADRRFAATVTEWPVSSLGLNAVGGTFATTATPASGPLPSGLRTLLLATLAYCGDGAPTNDDAAFSPLLPSSVGGVAVGVWHRVADPGTHEAHWTLPMAIPTVTGLVAMTLD